MLATIITAKVPCIEHALQRNGSRSPRRLLRPLPQAHVSNELPPEAINAILTLILKLWYFPTILWVPVHVQKRVYNHVNGMVRDGGMPAKLSNGVIADDLAQVTPASCQTTIQTENNNDRDALCFKRITGRCTSRSNAGALSLGYRLKAQV